MSYQSAIRGPCHWQSALGEPCRRRAKVQMNCANCPSTVKACAFHRDQVHQRLQEHVRDQHPREFAEAMRRANGAPLSSTPAAVDVGKPAT